MASGWKSTIRGTKLQISAPRAASVPCHVGGGARPDPRRKFRMGKARVEVPSQPTMSSGDWAQRKP
jgi:hypothetical protein